MCDHKHYFASPYATVVEITDRAHYEDDLCMSFPRLVFGVDEDFEEEDIRVMVSKSFKDLEVVHVFGNLISYDLPIACCLKSLKDSIAESLRKIKEGAEEVARMQSLHDKVFPRGYSV